MPSLHDRKTTLDSMSQRKLSEFSMPNAVVKFPEPTPRSFILLVDDDESEMLLLERALRKAGITDALVRARNGEEAISILSGVVEAETNGEESGPLAIFLDLAMPKVDGVELLSWIRGQPQLDGVVKAVVSGATDGFDLRKAQDLGADFVLAKPAPVERVSRVVKWARQVRASA